MSNVLFTCDLIYVVTVMQVLIQYLILLHVLFDIEFVKLNDQTKNWVCTNVIGFLQFIKWWLILAYIFVEG